MKSIETEGKTVEQAIEIGLYKLGKKREEVTIQVLEQGGLFSKAKVKILDGEQSETEKSILDMAQELLNMMNVSCVASVEEKEKEVVVNISGDDVGVVIGKRGDILESFQYILSLMVNKGKHGEDYKKVIVDSSNYRTRREEALNQLALRMASKATREGRIIKLEPMNANERRIIHNALSNNDRVSTESKGNEPFRYLSIIPTKKNHEKFSIENNKTTDVKMRSNND